MNDVKKSYTDTLVAKCDWMLLKPEDTCATRAGKVVFGSLCAAATELVALVEFAASVALTGFLKPIDFFIPKKYTWLHEKIIDSVFINIYRSLKTVRFLFRRTLGYFRNLHIDGFPQDPYGWTNQHETYKASVQSTELKQEKNDSPSKNVIEKREAPKLPSISDRHLISRYRKYYLESVGVSFLHGFISSFALTAVPLAFRFNTLAGNTVGYALFTLGGFSGFFNFIKIMDDRDFSLLEFTFSRNLPIIATVAGTVAGPFFFKNVYWPLIFPNDLLCTCLPKC